MNRKKTVKYAYIISILALSLSIGAVQLNTSPVGNTVMAKHLPQDSESGSIFSITNAIVRLYLLLPVFTDPENRAGMSLTERVAAEKEFISLLNDLPVDKILDKMNDLELVTTEQLSRIKHKRPYIDRLAKVAMNGIMKPETTEVSKHGEVYFKSGLKSPTRNSFEATNEAVYAFFDSSEYQDKNIFVKWYESNQGRMALFKQFPIMQKKINYIWIHNSGGFAKGRYQVEIYRINESFDLLSKGNFEVQ